MKKLFSVMLALIMMMSVCGVAFASDSTFGSYDRVVILGIDGAGAFFDDTDTPEMDRIFSENSAVTNECVTEIPSISAQCWGAMLLGVTEDRHDLTNEILETVERTSAEKYPSIFRVAHEADPDAVLASFCNWNPINIGLIENDLGVYEATAGDAELTDMLVDYLGENDPQLLFVQFDSVDGAGHSGGYGKENHLAAITTVDSYIGRIFDRLTELGRIDSTLFLVVADHGGTPGGSHGGATRAEKNVFLGVRGYNVTSGTISDAETRDVAAITLHALGYTQPEIMTSRVPAGIFADCLEVERPLGDSSLKQFMEFMDFVKEYFPLLLTIISQISGFPIGVE